jgi:hypothetical protein
MKLTILLLAVLAFHISARGDDIPKYAWCREWVETHCDTNTSAKEQSVFVGHDTAPQYASVIHFYQGIDLREIIDHTPFKKGSAVLWIMHQHPKDREPWGEFITVKPSEKPKFEVRESDVIWIWMYDAV